MQTENTLSFLLRWGGGLHGHTVMGVPPVGYAAEHSPIAYILEINLGEGLVFPPNIAAGVPHTLEHNYAGSAAVFQEQIRTHTRYLLL